MTEQEMLTAMAELLKPIQEKLDSVEQETIKVKLLLETDVSKEIKLIHENVQLIRETQLSQDRVDDLEDAVDVLKAAVKTHSREIRELKEAL